MKTLQHNKNKRDGFLLVEVVLAITLFAMAVLVIGQLMMLQHKRMEHTRTIIAMQEILEREKAKALSGREEGELALPQTGFRVQKEEFHGEDEMGIPGLTSRRIAIKVEHIRSGWTEEIVIIALEAGNDL